MTSTDPIAVHLALPESMSDWETGHATAHINKPDWQAQPGRYQVVTVGLTDRPITTMGGLQVTPDVTVDQVEPTDSAMLILPGSDIWHSADATAPFVDLAQRFLATGTPVAAICGATYALAAAGLLDERAHTSNDPRYLEMSGYRGGERYDTERTAVTDGNLITATATRPVDFAAEIFGKLGLYEPTVLESWLKLYRDNDPQGFYELMAVQ